MIVKMKKVSFLLFYKDRDIFLRALQDTGVLHIEENHVADCPDTTSATSLIKRCDQAIKALKSISSVSEPQAENIMDGMSVLVKYEELFAKQAELETQYRKLKEDLAKIEPWGDFDPVVIAGLKNAGIDIKFFKTVSKNFPSIKTESAVYEIINKIDNNIFFIAISHGKLPSIKADEIILPDRNLSGLYLQIDEVKKRKTELESELKDLTKNLDAIETLRSEQIDIRNFKAAVHNMSTASGDRLIYFSGWVPLDKEKTLTKMVENQPVYYEIRTPRKDEDVPVLLKNNPLTRLMEPVLKLYGLPAYAEIDPTLFFTPFFILFVGLCIGDVAYGAILLLLSITGYFKASQSLRPFMSLGIILGFSTMFSGFLLNSFFGNTIFGGEHIAGGPPIFPNGAKFSPFTPVSGTHGIEYPMMSFALLVGFLQVMLALLIRTIVKLRNGGIASALPSFSYITLTTGALIWGAHVNFLNLGIAGFNVSGIPFGNFLLLIPKTAGMTMFFISFPLFFIFANSDKKPGERVFQDIVDFYNGITGLFGNILSYLRLFALGLSGGMLAGVFNQLAIMILPKVNGQTRYTSALIIFSILLMIFGHALNFALALLGAFVHPLRLTFVEFLQNLDYKWGGKEYTPFSRSAPVKNTESK
jgi:V/A-type H+-transporting ATPase subunit I